MGALAGVVTAVTAAGKVLRMGEVYLPSADQLIQAAFVRAWLGLYWHYKEIIRALEQGDEQWIIPTHSQPEADFAQFGRLCLPVRCGDGFVSPL